MRCSTMARSSRRLANFRRKWTICPSVNRFFFRFHVGPGTFSTCDRWIHVCHFASSYTSTGTNVQKIQPTYAPHNSVYKCVGRLNFLYICSGRCVWRSKLTHLCRVRWAKFEQNFNRWMSTKMYARAQNCPETGRPTSGTSQILPDKGSYWINKQAKTTPSSKNKRTKMPPKKRRSLTIAWLLQLGWCICW